MQPTWTPSIPAPDSGENTGYNNNKANHPSWQNGHLHKNQTKHTKKDTKKPRSMSAAQLWGTGRWCSWAEEERAHLPHGWARFWRAPKPHMSPLIQYTHITAPVAALQLNWITATLWKWIRFISTCSWRHHSRRQVRGKVRGGWWKEDLCCCSPPQGTGDRHFSLLIYHFGQKNTAQELKIISSQNSNIRSL